MVADSLTILPTRVARSAPRIRYAANSRLRSFIADENTANTSINYYPKGAVIAFLLDAKIRKATSGSRSLDTGMQWAMQRYSGDKGYTPAQFYAVMSEAAGTDLKGWFAQVAESTEELDYTEALEYYGLRFRPEVLDVTVRTKEPVSAVAATIGERGLLVFTVTSLIVTRTGAAACDFRK